MVALLLGGDGALPTLDAIGRLFIHVGRYALFPLVLFGAAVGVYELKREKKTLVTLGRILLYMTIASALLAVVGTLSTIVFAPDRIPIIIEEEIIYSVPSLSQVLLSIFPRNLFAVATVTGDHLLPIFIFALILGLNLTFDRLATRPAIQLFESLNRVFYNLNAFVLEIIAIGFIPITAAFLLRLSSTPELSLYRQLILVLVIDTLFVMFVLYPILIYFGAGKRNPYRWLYTGLGTLFVAAVTGDAFFSLTAQIRHTKENFGVPRRIGAVSLPIFTLFGKAGTAMVTGTSFVLIVTSYSSLGITIAQTVWIMVFAFLASLAVGSFPGIGIIVALSILSSGFSSGFEEGFLILSPVLPVLMSFAVTLDVLTASLATMLVARHSGSQNEIEPSEYV
jgi:aerobic C4-dicarboxylate transport protein